jgi:rhamnosyltransferase
MKISVVMLTYNGGAELRQVVEVLQKQDVQAEVEYVAVDSESTDGTCEFLKAAGFRVYSIKKKDFSYGPTREYAFQCSTGDVLVTQSQDVLPVDQTYLQVMIDPIVKGQADVVQGLTLVPREDNRLFLWDRMGVTYFTSEGHEFMRKHGNIGLSCTSMAISRQAWQATGFAGTSYCTDKFIQRKLAEKGFRMIATPGVVAYHGHSYNLRSLIKRCTNEGLGWRIAGAKYSIRSFLYDLTLGFARHAKMWARAIYRREARDPATIFFFQIRPVCILIGNRILKNVIR